MTDELDKELNEALGIEDGANHTQRLVTILNLRTQALREQETLLELEKVTRQRDKVEDRLVEVLAGHVHFIESIHSRASAIKDVTEAFQGDVAERVAESFLDAFDLALAKMREQRDNGKRHKLDDVVKEEGVSLDPDDFGVNEVDPEEIDISRETTEDQIDQDAAPLLERLQKVVTDPETSGVLNLGVDAHVGPVSSFVLQDPFTAEEIGKFRQAREEETDTTQHDETEPQPVPFTEPSDITLAEDTRKWMATMAEGGTRDDS
jgi:hypothetical protein